ncbi:MAG TPA: UTP--glucose-1-phosphate uridylyltransferase [Polyangiaceae bacterium]|jgi:UTP--glucose-1-phosphate uridylyltransferase|nr:UTP--glucose-1-phosphate uridylyltransferase [Polyangiaceae bacterium]
MSQKLRTQLAQLPEDVKQLLRQHHFDEPQFLALAADMRSASDRNQVKGEVLPPHSDDVQDLPAAGSTQGDQLAQLGEAALRAGQCALVVLAGGMATRMGGVVKALVEALPGKTFLDLRLAEMQTLSRKVQRPVPLWLMTSSSTDAGIRQALGARNDGSTVAVFPQRLSPRLSPHGDLFQDEQGQISLHAPGHGDLPDALRDSGLLQKFVANGGRYVTVANLDNLGAGIDPRVIGFHISHGKVATCEVVDKQGTDRGGIPVRFAGKPQVLEEFRLPSDFDPDSVRVFNTNTFHFDARALLETPFDWTYFVVHKKVGDQPAIQFERLVGELTSHLTTRFLRVPREGKEGRFLPVKDFDELNMRRAEIERIASHRGMLT